MNLYTEANVKILTPHNSAKIYPLNKLSDLKCVIRSGYPLEEA